jgi:hypothetical protein
MCTSIQVQSPSENVKHYLLIAPSPIPRDPTAIGRF